jgi:hypothetical protein
MRGGVDGLELLDGDEGVDLRHFGVGVAKHSWMKKMMSASGLSARYHGAADASEGGSTTNELDYYSLGLKQLAEKLGLSSPRALALVRHSGMQNSDDYFRSITVGKATFKRYSQKALQKLKDNLSTVDMNDVWTKHRKPLVAGKSD